MLVRIKKLKANAIIPKYSRSGDAAMDLVATNIVIQPSYIEYQTGLAIEIPENHVGLIFPRSSISNLKNTYLANSTGVIDSNFRGEICLRFRSNIIPYNVGDRIGQILIIPYPTIEFQESEELSDTNRGSKGFGSSGN